MPMNLEKKIDEEYIVKKQSFRHQNSNKAMHKQIIRWTGQINQTNLLLLYSP